MGDARVYRGMVRMGLTAGFLLSVIATGMLALGLEIGVVPSSIFGVRELIALAVRTFVAGAAAGGIFAWLVARREQGRDLSTLSPRRIAVWGGIAMGSIPLLAVLMIPGPTLPISVLLASTVLSALGGSAVSAGMLAAATRAERRLQASQQTERLLP